MERWRSKLDRKRRPQDQRKQSADLQEGPNGRQSLLDNIQEMWHLQSGRSPSGIPLLPAVFVQEGHLRHVRRQDPRCHQLPSNVRLSAGL